MRRSLLILVVMLLGATLSDAGRASAQGLTPTPSAVTCGFTAETTSGPYYISDVPETEDLNVLGLPGREMMIRGTVVDGVTGEPIAGAQIDIWHTDARGRYWPAASGEADDFDAKAVNLRGIVYSDEDGAYEFTSLEPGVYPGRPRHIHYRISAEGYLPIFTQTYWADDPAVRRDRADRNVDDCRLLVFEDMEEGGTAAIFTIVLRPDPTPKRA